MIAGKFWLCSIVILASLTVNAQKNKNQLQQEKQKNLQKIKEVEKILTETGAQKKNSIGELTALNQRIQSQELLIQSIGGELDFLNKEIGEDNSIVAALEDDLKILKEEYSAMLFAAQKADNSATRLTFIFSAKSFDQLVMRLRYMEQYGELRKLQADQIIKTQEQLLSQVRTTEAKRNEKNALLYDEVAENTQLTNLKTKQRALVKNLEKQEKQLKTDLDATKKAIAKLDNLIADIIREEIARTEREAREAKAKASKSKTPVPETANVILSESFADNKSKFSWPASGFVSQKFGRQNHPILKGILVENEGINIQTQKDESVKAIFQGEVRKVAAYQLIGLSVIIKHGDFLTVYTGLDRVDVRVGDNVTANQTIGKVQLNPDGISELRFRIYKGTTVLDPQLWLKN